MTTPTMMPAAAVVAATGNTPRPPDARAPASRRGVSAVSRFRKLMAMARTIAQKTERNVVKPCIISTTIDAIDAK